MTAKSRKRNVNQTEAVTSGTLIRMEQPQSNRKHKPNQAVMVVHEINPVSGFVGFLRDYAVVGLAVGFVIGLQAQTLMKQLVASFIDPLFNLLFGQALSTRTFTMEFHGRSSAFSWGAFAYGLLNFIFVIAAVYIIVKISKLDKLDKKKPTQADIAKIKEVQ